MKDTIGNLSTGRFRGNGNFSDRKSLGREQRRSRQNNNKHCVSIQRHTSADNSPMKNSRDLILGKVVYISIIYLISDSWLFSLNGYDFYFDHLTGENRELFISARWRSGRDLTCLVPRPNITPRSLVSGHVVRAKLQAVRLRYLLTYLILFVPSGT